jgi:hypothetical protein
MSRIAPKMEQLEAIKAKVYHVLPVIDGSVTFSVEKQTKEEPKTSEHFLVATDAQKCVKWKTSTYRFVYNENLETDVQDVFVVNLYVDGKYIVVKLEYNGTFRFDKSTGKNKPSQQK